MREIIMKLLPAVLAGLLLFAPSEVSSEETDVDGNAPDLTVVAVDSRETSTDCQTRAVAGTVSATIRNIGDSPVGSPWTVLFFEDRDQNQVFESGIDLFLGHVLALELLGPEEETTVSVAVDYSTDVLAVFIVLV